MPRKAAATPAPVQTPESPVSGTPEQPKPKKTPKPQKKSDRSQFTHCVWVGSSSAPKLWAKSEDEAKAYIAGLKPSKLGSVLLGRLSPVTVKVDIQIGAPAAAPGVLQA